MVTHLLLGAGGHEHALFGPLGPLQLGVHVGAALEVPVLGRSELGGEGVVREGGGLERVPLVGRDLRREGVGCRGSGEARRSDSGGGFGCARGQKASTLRNPLPTQTFTL